MENNEDKFKRLCNFLDNYCFGLTLNTNDTFGYGCADTEEVDLQDIPLLLEIEEKFGSSGVLAYMSKVRGVDIIKPLIDKQYRRAKKWLEDKILSYDCNSIEDVTVCSNRWSNYMGLKLED